MQSIYWICILALSVLMINGQQTDSNEILSISSGTSFGFCMGYCRQSIKLTSNPSQVIVSREANGNQGSYPPVHVKLPLTADEWNSLANLVNLETIQGMDETIGCPDCADGGAEWVQIDWANGSKRVTFENRQTVESIKELVEKLRDLRQIYLSKI